MRGSSRGRRPQSRAGGVAPRAEDGPGPPLRGVSSAPVGLPPRPCVHFRGRRPSPDTLLAQPVQQGGFLSWCWDVKANGSSPTRRSSPGLALRLPPRSCPSGGLPRAPAPLKTGLFPDWAQQVVAPPQAASPPALREAPGEGHRPELQQQGVALGGPQRSLSYHSRTRRVGGWLWPTSSHLLSPPGTANASESAPRTLPPRTRPSQSAPPQLCPWAPSWGSGPLQL